MFFAFFFYRSIDGPVSMCERVDNIRGLTHLVTINHTIITIIVAGQPNNRPVTQALYRQTQTLVIRPNQTWLLQLS